MIRGGMSLNAGFGQVRIIVFEHSGVLTTAVEGEYSFGGRVVKDGIGIFSSYHLTGDLWYS